MVNVSTQQNTKFVLNQKLDFMLIAFPVIPALIYILFSSSFNDLDYFNYVFFVFLGETHFAASMFFVRKENLNYARNNLGKIVYIPTTLIILYTLIGLTSLKFAIYLGAVASAYHVTKQSIGVFRIYNRKPDKKAEKLIWMTSSLFVIIGFLNFYVSDFGISFLTQFKNLFLYVSSAFLAFVVINIFFNSRYREFNLHTKSAFFTGCVIYFPYTFFDDPLVAAIVGVSCHWTQYLALTYAVYVRGDKSGEKRIRFISVLLFIVALTLLAIGEKDRIINQVSGIILMIPLIIQMLHYYYDSIMWKKSDPHINNEVFSRLYNE